MSLFVTAALAASFGLWSQTPPAVATVPTVLPPVVVVEPPRDPEERIVCRTESVVGSNRRQRVCMTLAEREERRVASQSQQQRLDRLANPSAAGDGQGTALTGRGF